MDEREFAQLRDTLRDFVKVQADTGQRQTQAFSFQIEQLSAKVDSLTETVSELKSSIMQHPKGSHETQIAVQSDRITVMGTRIDKLERHREKAIWWIIGVTVVALGTMVSTFVLNRG